MHDKKMCPMLTLGYLANRGYDNIDETVWKLCIGENCAFYYDLEHWQGCSISMIAYYLHWLCNIIKDRSIVKEELHA